MSTIEKKPKVIDAPSASPAPAPAPARSAFLEGAGLLSSSEPDTTPLTFPHEYMGDGYQSWASRFSEREKALAAQRLRSLFYGPITALPKQCGGLERCVYKTICPFQENVPVGLACPMEQAVILKILEELKKDFKTDEFAKTDAMLFNRLIELELMDYRLNAMGAQTEWQDPIMLKTIGMTNSGIPIETLEANPLYALKEKVAQEKARISKSLVGTPEARVDRRAKLKEDAGKTAYERLQGGMRNVLDAAEAALAEVRAGRAGGSQPPPPPLQASVGTSTAVADAPIRPSATPQSRGGGRG